MITIPAVPFYFVRHGQTDLNRGIPVEGDHDIVPLNATGVKQAEQVSKRIASLGITHIYASPLVRAQQTAAIINHHMMHPISIELYDGLASFNAQSIAFTVAEILKEGQIALLVSHAYVYEWLLELLEITPHEYGIRNGGLYYFSPEQSDQWIVKEW